MQIDTPDIAASYKRAGCEHDPTAMPSVSMFKTTGGYQAHWSMTSGTPPLSSKTLGQHTVWLLKHLLASALPKPIVGMLIRLKSRVLRKRP